MPDMASRWQFWDGDLGFPLNQEDHSDEDEFELCLLNINKDVTQRPSFFHLSQKLPMAMFQRRDSAVPHHERMGGSQSGSSCSNTSSKMRSRGRGRAKTLAQTLLGKGNLSKPGSLSASIDQFLDCEMGEAASSKNKKPKQQTPDRNTPDSSSYTSDVSLPSAHIWTKDLLVNKKSEPVSNEVDTDRNVYADNWKPSQQYCSKFNGFPTGFNGRGDGDFPSLATGVPTDYCDTGFPGFNIAATESKSINRIISDGFVSRNDDPGKLTNCDLGHFAVIKTAVKKSKRKRKAILRCDTPTSSDNVKNETEISNLLKSDEAKACHGQEDHTESCIIVNPVEENTENITVESNSLDSKAKQSEDNHVKNNTENIMVEVSTLDSIAKPSEPTSKKYSKGSVESLDGDSNLNTENVVESDSEMMCNGEEFYQIEHYTSDHDVTDTMGSICPVTGDNVVIISGLPQEISEEDLLSFLSSYGDVGDFRVFEDEYGGLMAEARFDSTETVDFVVETLDQTHGIYSEDDCILTVTRMTDRV